MEDTGGGFCTNKLIGHWEGPCRAKRRSHAVQPLCFLGPLAGAEDAQHVLSVDHFTLIAISSLQWPLTKSVFQTLSVHGHLLL